MPKNLLSSLTLLFLVFMQATSSMAANFKPAVVYDKVGKHDRSFNEAVYKNGVLRFKEEFGVTVHELEPQFRTQRNSGLKRLAAEGFSPIVTVGFSFSQIVEETAKEYPDAQFVLIDGVVDLPNVKSILFAEHEGSFLVGTVAAMKTKSNVIGFVGGMDIPLIRKFGCGFAQGAHHVNKDITVLSEMIGSTPAAFRSPEKGSRISLDHIKNNADVLYAAAGESGIGVISTAFIKSIHSIGVDSNQNWMRPGSVLTSMVKDVGLAAFKTWEVAMNGKFTPGIEVLNMADGGVNWALDHNNSNLFDEATIEKINAIKDDIISGKIKVHDYSQDNSCPE